MARTQQPGAAGDAEDTPAARLAELTPRLRAMARRLGLRGANAEDCAQDAIVAAVEALQRGKISPKDVRRWTFGVARKRALDRLRVGARRRLARLGPELPCLRYAADRSARAKERDARWEAALARLTVGQRACFELLAAGRTARETAAALGITTGAVYQRVHAARARLAKKESE
jgi:RNA polymerase sigma factor (sigma-70 family)